MTVKYVVSIADTLLYFDAQYQPAEPFPEQATAAQSKPALTLIPPSEKPAARAEWNDALSSYSAEQRGAAEISEVV